MDYGRLGLVTGDITLAETEAIVNAANNSLLGGGGVDGAIHRAAGPQLLEECRALNGCETGQSKISGAYELKAKYIIHTVGPVWNGGYSGESALLASCYQTLLQLAADKKIKSLSIPAISTGAYRFPKDLAAMIAINECRRFLKRNSYPEKVIFVVFSDEIYQSYQKLLE
ncbi:MAG: O-acetyl-ADP-ribose deacetylase [Bacteroidales bacterium]|jgi:O-acetyl-ADP-ribose deacetylase (regulator of RNase III)|nr:O-acetyl-ADP-ribose deacetylase [Bacteroidales bacterium]